MTEIKDKKVETRKWRQENHKKTAMILKIDKSRDKFKNLKK